MSRENCVIPAAHSEGRKGARRKMELELRKLRMGGGVVTFSPWEQPPSPLPVVELEAASDPSARPLSFGENVGNRIPRTS